MAAAAGIQLRLLCNLLDGMLAVEAGLKSRTGEIFKSDVLPRIKANAGFQAVRNMLNRETGHGLVGTAWANQDAMKAAAAEAQSRRQDGVARGVSFGDVSYREVLFSDLR